MIPKWVCQILKGIAVTGFLCLAPDESTQAADHYFSDCSHRPSDQRTGCYNAAAMSTCSIQSPAGGSRENPWCPDINGDGSIEWFAAFSDSSSALPGEFSAGDTAYLCADKCGEVSGMPADASDLTTVDVRSTGEDTSVVSCGTYFFQPKMNNLTIQNYSDEIVTIRGSEDLVATTPDTIGGDPEALINNGPTKYSGMTIKSASTGKLKFSRSEDNMFCSRGGGFPGWTFDGIDATEGDFPTWGVTSGIGSLGASCGSGSQGNYCFFITGHTGTFTLTNSTIHTCCHSAMRFVASPSSTSLTVTNNTFYDATTSVEFWDSSTATISGNTIYDMSVGIQIEDRASTVTISDNDISCRGITIPSSTGRCTSAIKISDGDSTGIPGLTHDISILRNKIWATNVGGTPSERGRFLGGIVWTADCDSGAGCTSLNSRIENNMIWNLQASISGNTFSRGSISAMTFPGNVLKIYNNTIYMRDSTNSSYGIQLSGCGGTSSAEVKNNIIHAPIASSSSRNVSFYGGSDPTTFTFNNVYRDASDSRAIGTCSGTPSSAPYCRDQTPDCGTLSNEKTCAQVSTVGSDNKCAASSFVDAGNPTVANRDYHLAPPDTANVDAGTIFSGDCSSSGDGIECDFDKDVRPVGAAFDIGADESLLIDGGFESGAFGNGGAAVDSCLCAQKGSISNVSPIAGTYSLKITPTIFNEGACVGDPVARCYDPKWSLTGLTAGTSYRMTGTARFTIVDTGVVNLRMFLVCVTTNCSEFIGPIEESSLIGIPNNPPTGNNGFLQPFFFNFTATGSSMTLRLMFLTGANITNDFVTIDNLHLTKVVTP